MKKIYFLAAFAAFVFSACSDDKEDNNNSLGGCLIKMDGVHNYECIEEGGVYGTKEVCSHMGEWVDSCPPGTRCEVESSDGIKFIATFYDVVPSSCQEK